jgi:UDP-N-acetylmuramoyl-tripeptide--D-alanyl-D-alanine ligase
VSEPLWSWPDLRLALGMRDERGPAISGFSIDSRRISPGDLFVALPGDPGPRFRTSSRSDRDGHDFVGAAFAAGAAAALVHRDGSYPGPVLRVADTLDGLWALGRARRTALSGPVAAVTGSSGKTTAKTLLAAALKAYSSAGSLNNHIGVPLSLATTPRGARPAVYEIGTNHPGEIAPLARLVSPHVAVVLNVHPAHAEFFADRAELLREKLSIHEGLTAAGPLVVETGLDTSALPAERPLFRFGDDPDADCQLLALDGVVARYRLAGRELTAHVPGGGRHRATTLAAVLSVLYLIGADPEAALDLGDALVPRGRGNHLHTGDVVLIDDSYNANPASMAAALDGLAAMASGRRVAVLGDMLELGAGTVDYHRALARHCAPIDRVVCVGPNMRSLYDTFDPAADRHAFDAADDRLLEWLATTLTAGDVVLVKGSNRIFWARDFVGRLAARLADAGGAKKDPGF